MTTLEYFNYHDATLQFAVMMVIFNPIYWNVVSRLEYYTHFLTKITRNPRIACYLFASTIFCLGLVRNYYFEEALNNQLVCTSMDNVLMKIIGFMFIVLGQVLVFTSMFQLGIVGTYCGDYFGILMKEKVTRFPFNVCENPMYRGSTLSFLGYSLLQAKPAGLVLTLIVHLMYDIVLKIEEPFTTKIYASKSV